MKTIQYIGRRLLYLLPVMLGVSILTFLMLHLTPGDPVELMLPADVLADPAVVEAMRVQLGLDQPLHIQYFRYMSRALRGDLGTSIQRQRPVTFLIMQDLPFTLELSVTALFIDVFAGVFLGVLASVNAGRIIDTAAVMIAVVGVSVPTFWFGLLMIYLFGVRLALFPVLGQGGIEKLIMPAVTLAIGGMASLGRVTRSSMLEVLGSDYIRTARAKGLLERVVIYRHALRNALIPVATIIGMRIGNLLAGSAVIENVFFRRGIGRLMLSGIMGKDFPLVQGVVLMMAFSYVLVNLAVDVVYSVIDPRISYD